MSTMPQQPQSQQSPQPHDEPKTKSVKWSPVTAEDHLEVRLAEGSIKPMSGEKLAKIAIELKKVGAIDVRHLLEWLEIPDADEIAEAVENEQKLAALAKVTRK